VQQVQEQKQVQEQVQVQEQKESEIPQPASLESVDVLLPGVSATPSEVVELQ
jgi:hypothetical protein